MRTRILMGVASLAIGGCGGAAAAPATPATQPHPTAAPESAPAVPTPVLDAHRARAVEIVRGLHGPELEATYATFGESFRAAIPLESVRSIAGGIGAKLGKLTDARYADEDTQDQPGWRRMRVVAFFERGAMLYTLTLDDQRVVRGLLVTPLAKSDEEPGKGPDDDYVAKHAYLLPGRGQWTVGNGGPSAKTNNHVGNKQQWYAFDLVVKGADGKTFTGDGKKNEDYLAFGQPIVAPADATVVTIVDGVPDNVPGDQNRYVVPGNFVILDHGDGEFSVLCHVERGSFAVKVGARVKAGDVLGKVGNSGNTSEPHIHWHLANDARIGEGHGLPIRFAKLLVNGAAAENAVPVRDDVLEVAKK